MRSMPTIADFAGIKRLPDGVEGGSLAAVLRGDAKAEVARPREDFVVHFPHYDLGNEFFALILDSTMMYSSAIFAQPHMTLEAAQLARLFRLQRLKVYQLIGLPGETDEDIDELADEYLTGGSTPPEEAERRQTVVRVRAAVARLPVALRAVVYLLWFAFIVLCGAVGQHAFIYFQF